MATWTIAALGGIAFAWLSYRGVRVRARAALFALRAIAATVALAILLGAPSGRARAGSALVVLDVSSSWRRGGDSAAWSTAARRAHDAGADTLWLAGDSLRAGVAPATPADLATRVAPAAARARVSGRPLVLITDGEVDDASAMGELPPGSRIEIPPRASRVDAAVSDLDVLPTAVAGDTIIARATIRAGDAPIPAGTLSLRLDARTVATVRTEALEARAEEVVPLRAIAPAAPGHALLSVLIDAAGDAERRNDTLTVALTIARGAGVVFVSTAPDEDMRALVPLLRRTLALPARGFFLVAPERWRREGTLEAATVGDVRAALRSAPIAILHGDTALLGLPRTLTGGALLLWPTAERDAGEWFAIAAPPSPVAGAMAGTPWDSLPPLALAERAPTGDWTALEVARARRYDARGAIAGTEHGRRQVVSGASGFWRWRFRGGASEAAFATLWGGILDWLAADRRDPRAAFPASGVIRAGEPVSWRRGDAPSEERHVAVVMHRRGSAATDTLQLDFSAGETTVASAPLAAGVYDAAVAGGTAVLAVNASREWLPRAPTLVAATVGGRAAGGDRPPLRDAGAAYLLAIAALGAEWFLRRRAGLR